MTPPLAYATIDSPVGPLRLTARGGVLVSVSFEKGRHAGPPAGAVEDPSMLAAVIGQLDEYFRGTRRAFDVPLAPEGTEFQLAVWRALQEIPYGETRTYGEIAGRIGRPSASRAVGAANGANPIPIIIPCHRVIGSSGALTGFGGGIAVKRALLDLEAGKLALAFP